MFDSGLTSGDTLYKYTLLEKIGGGSFGEVWLAHDRVVDSNMAIKILAPNVAIDEKLKEARIGNRLDHDNLVKVHYADVVEKNGNNFVIIAMDYLQNGSIISEVNACNFLPIPITLSYIVDVLRGLEYLHELNIYHNDIKPQNILKGNSGQAVLSDYGIACHSSSGISSKPSSFYKIHASSEVLSSGLIDIRNDIYQVGMTLFRLLNGLGLIEEKFRRLGEASFNDLVKGGRIITAKDYLPFIPRSLKSIVNKSTNVDPDKRYQSAVEMRRALERLNFPGYWTCDSKGNFLGMNGKYEYSYEVVSKSRERFDIHCYKKHKDTERQTKVGRFCKKNIDKGELDNLIIQFMSFVVEGI
jgi:serine/threonine protein kinase